MPNPKLKLMDQVREVMRLKHYAIRTEKCYCDWIRRFVRFHGMKSRADLSPGGSGLRLLEGLRLRVKDLDFEMKQLTVRDGKGARDRYTVLAEGIIPALREHLEGVRLRHEEDLRAGHGSVYLPGLWIGSIREHTENGGGSTSSRRGTCRWIHVRE